MPSLAEWLVDELDADLAKRRRELIDLRLMVSSTTGARLAMVSRTCHVMAYAHWEGFVKQALQAYLTYIVKQQINIGDLQHQLQALAVRTDMRVALVPERNVDPLATYLKDFSAKLGEPFTIEPAEVIRSGNLTAENLKTLLGCAGLAYEPSYQARANYIDKVVCGRRHRVAHGSWQPVTPVEARDVIADVMALCQEVNEQVQTAALYEHFRL